jgi:histidinol phosphatase-like PHP family hydrolase
VATHRTSSKRAAKVLNTAVGVPPGVRATIAADRNFQAAALLYELSALQANPRSQMGYKRSAGAVIALPIPLEDVVAAGGLREIPYIGPSSARVLTEFLATGRSATVEEAVARSGKRAEVERLRQWRNGFLSHHAMLQALEATLPKRIVSREAYRGDFQMHSTWSDGAERIGTLVLAAMELGHTCLGITDHSYGLPVARGMTMANVVRQHREIDRLNDRYAGHFRVFKGIEANILVDGSLDLSLDERRAFEFVVASPHSQLRRSDDQTARMVGAVRHPGVAILGHPRGRMFQKRAGVVADWDAVFGEAARRRVAIELDGNWHRQDMDYLLARRALEAGCLFALDSDAHSIPELRFSEYAIAHARLAGIPTERVINCWGDDALEAWMKEKAED